MAVKQDMTVKRRKPSAHNRNGNASQEFQGLSVVPVKRKRRRHTFLRALFRLFLTAVLIFSGVYIWNNWDMLEPENIVYWLNDKLAGGQSGDGFPVEISGSSVLSLTKANDGLALLTDTSLVVLNSKGGELYRRQHGFSNPVMRTEGKRILLADIGGSRMKVETRAGTTIEMTTDNNIISAAIGENGYFALVTDSSGGHTSEVVVYNRKLEKIYHWYDRDLVILDAALSPDGKSMTVVGVMADGGAMKYAVKMLYFNKKEPVAVYDGHDMMVFAVGYFPNGTIAVIGDGAVWIFNEKGTIRQRHSYNDRQLAGYTIWDSSVSVALRDFGGKESGAVMTINPSGDQAYTMPFEGAFRSIASHGSNMLLLTSDYLYRADSSGVRYTSDVIRDGRMISTMGNKVIILGLTTLDEHNLPTTKS